MKVKVDNKICCGHALCAARAPEVYTLDVDGFCNSDGLVVPQADEQQARLGAASCPEGAITLDEA